jgi:hypothetical protein
MPAAARRGEDLPELMELADLLRTRVGRVDPFEGDELIDKLCRKVYGGTVFEADGFNETVIDKFKPVVAPQSILPVSSMNELKSIGHLLQKTTLYSNLTVAVCPYEARYSERIDTPNMARGTNADLAKILEANTIFRSLLRQGRCVFLPRSYESETVRTLKAEIRRCKAPMRQHASRLSPLPLNTSLHTPTPQRDLLLLHTIELPYFPADLNLIANIATEYTDSFVRFTHFLATRIAAIGGAPSPDDLARILAEIEDEVATLRTEAKKLSRTRVLSGIEVASFAISIVALILPQTEAFKSLASVTGAATLIQLIRGYVDSRNTALDLEKSPFYIPYVLSKKQAVR